MPREEKLAPQNKLPRSKLRGIKRKKHCLGAKQASGNRTLQGIEQFLHDNPQGVLTSFK
jgi:hypothetical protein